MFSRRHYDQLLSSVYFVLLFGVGVFVFPPALDPFLIPKQFFSEIFIALLVGLMAFKALRVSSRYCWGKYHILGLVFVLYVFVHMIIGEASPYASSQTVRQLCAYGLAFAVSYHLAKSRVLNKSFTMIFSLSGLWISLIGLLQILGWDAIVWGPRRFPGGIPSTLGNKQFLASYLIMVIPLIGLNILEQRKSSWQRRISIFSFVISMAMLFAARSLSALLVLIFWGGFLWLRSRSLRRLLAGRLILIMVTACAVVLFVRALPMKTDALGQRALYYKIACGLWAKAPFWGLGPGSFGSFYGYEKQQLISRSPLVEPGAISVDWHDPHAESDLLEFLVEFGFFGLLILGVSVFFFIKDSRSYASSPPDASALLLVRGLSFALIGELLFSLVNFPFRLHASGITFFSIAGVLASFCEQNTFCFRLSARLMPGKTAACAFISVCLCFVFISAAKPLLADIYYHRGLRQFRSGEAEKSLALFFRAWAWDPRRGELLVRAGESFLSLGLYREASNIISKGLLGFEKKQSFYLLGEASRGQKFYDEALTFYAVALSLDPYYRPARRARADVLIKKGLWNEGEKILVKMAYDEQDADAYTELCWLALKKREISKALSLYKHISRLGKKHQS